MTKPAIHLVFTLHVHELQSYSTIPLQVRQPSWYVPLLFRMQTFSYFGSHKLWVTMLSLSMQSAFVSMTIKVKISVLRAQTFRVYNNNPLSKSLLQKERQREFVQLDNLTKMQAWIDWPLSYPSFSFRSSCWQSRPRFQQLIYEMIPQ